MKADAIAMVFIEVRNSAQPGDEATLLDIEQEFAHRAREELSEALKDWPNIRVVGAPRITKLTVEPG